MHRKLAALPCSMIGFIHGVIAIDLYNTPQGEFVWLGPEMGISNLKCDEVDRRDWDLRCKTLLKEEKGNGYGKA